MLHSVADREVRGALEEGCARLNVPCRFVLEPFVPDLAEYYGATVRFRASVRDLMDEDYFRRVEAMKYTLSHDDGVCRRPPGRRRRHPGRRLPGDENATCLYLASRGIKAANVPLVPGVPLPQGLVDARKPFIVGLTVNPAHLARVRGAGCAC